MSITSQVVALTQDRNDIRTALIARGVPEASGSGFDEFPEDILKICTGSSGLYIDFSNIGYSFPENVSSNAEIYHQLKLSYWAKQRVENSPQGTSLYHSASSTGYWFPNMDFTGKPDLSYLAENNNRVRYIGCLDLSSGVETVKWAFHSCPNLEYVGEISSSDDLWQIADMFRSCSNLSSVPTFNTSHVVDFTGMFWGCTSLTSVPEFEITASGNNTLYGPGSISMDDMFRACTGLTTISSSIFANMGGVKNAGAMFKDCSNLVSIEQTLDLGSLTYSEEPISHSGYWGGNCMFEGCTKLQNLKIENLRVNLGTQGIKDCPLTSESINYIIEHLGIPEAGTDTFYVGSSNLAKLSSSSIASAESKGWTISS